jgi:hypothetical protein
MLAFAFEPNKQKFAKRLKNAAKPRFGGVLHRAIIALDADTRTG